MKLSLLFLIVLVVISPGIATKTKINTSTNPKEVMSYYKTVNAAKWYGEDDTEPPKADTEPSKADVMSFYKRANAAKTYGPDDTETPKADVMSFYKRANAAKTYVPDDTDTPKADVMSFYKRANAAKTYVPDDTETPKTDVMMSSSSKLFGHVVNTDAVQHYPIIYFRPGDMWQGRVFFSLFTEFGKEPFLNSTAVPKNSWKMWKNKTQCQTHSCVKDEVRSCVDSKESMRAFALSVLGGSNESITMLSTSNGMLQHYRVKGAIMTISRHATACHKQSFNTPFAVYLCHSIPKTAVKVIPLLGLEDGKSIKALAMCHDDSSSWYPDSIIFKILKIAPGPAVCHFMTTDDLIWV